MERPAPMIRAIFFTRFHPEKGPRVLHQVPEGSIVPPSDHIEGLPEPLFDFRSVSDYLIPRQEFSDRLVTVCVNHFRIIGFPVCIEDSQRYDRNEFIFNLAIVLDKDADMTAHSSVVRKLARMFRNLEEQSGFLSNEEDEELWDAMSDYEDEKGADSGIVRRPGLGLSGSPEKEVGNATGLRPERGQKVYALCEMILEDLNNYCECMIPIDEANTINLKLFPARPPPAPVRAWHVPLLTIQPSLLSISTTSDLTLTRVLPFINGIRSVAQIARLADADLSLARKAVQHLLYYGCVLLLDIFQFSAVYAPTPGIRDFVEDVEAQDEAIGYVSVGQYQQVTAMDSSTGQSLVVPLSTLPSSVGTRRTEAFGSTSKRAPRNVSPSTASIASKTPMSSSPLRQSVSAAGTAQTPQPSPPSTDSKWAWHPHDTSLSRARIIQLYMFLKPGLVLRDWCVQNETLLSGIDVRRFITFGIIKGFLYRVHRWGYVDLAAFKGWTPEDVGTGPQDGDSADRFTRWDARVKQFESGSNSAQGSPRNGLRDEMAAQGQGLELSRARLAEATRDMPLAKYLDGLHCFDEVCTELQMSEKEVWGRMKAVYGDKLHIIAR